MDDFQKLNAKVDSARNLPAAVVLKKFIRNLNPKIAPLVYTSNPANLNATIDTATRIATGMEMSTGTAKINHIDQDDEIAQLKEQIANLALIEQIRVEQ